MELSTRRCRTELALEDIYRIQMSSVPTAQRVNS